MEKCPVKDLGYSQRLLSHIVCSKDPHMTVASSEGIREKVTCTIPVQILVTKTGLITVP